MTWHRVVALLKLKVTFCSLVRRELCGLQRAGSFSAPRIGPRVVLATEKLKEARMTSGILQHLQRIWLDIPKTETQVTACAFNQALVRRWSSIQRQVHCVQQHAEFRVCCIWSRGRNDSWDVWFQNRDETTGLTLHPATRYDSSSHSLPFPASFLPSFSFEPTLPDLWHHLLCDVSLPFHMEGVVMTTIGKLFKGKCILTFHPSVLHLLFLPVLKCLMLK